MDYTWAYQGTPQDGSLLIALDQKANCVTAHWVDSWHMSDAVMACTGPRPGSDTVSLIGAYPAPPGPDWGWRIELTPDRARGLKMVMFNIWPGGTKEELAMEATYRKE